MLYIPSIVQAKFWSDFVAGLIEGTSKFKQRINLREKDLSDILPNIKAKNHEIEFIAVIDLLYLFKTDPRTRNSLKYILPKTRTLPGKIYGVFKHENNLLMSTDFSDYEYLRKWFAETSHFFQLIDFILEKYRPHQALSLTCLVSENYDDFNRWLSRNKPSK
jgi:hypothetical protein